MLLSVTNAAKSYGGDLVFEGVGFRVNAGEKVALVGRNGEGKTTLLKALTGELELDTGAINLARGAEMDYLSQVAHFEQGATVRQVAEDSRKHVLDLRDRLAELEKRLESNPTEDELDEFSVLHEHFLDNRGYAAETDVRLVLNRMGFAEDEFDKPAAKLSGGEKTRLTLARILLEEPDILLLDEPTNHLDLEGVEWLEEWLRSYRGAVITVSHDRRFLENVATRVIEMRDHGITDWLHPFTKYLQLREEDEIRRADIVKKQQKEIDALDEFVRRFMNSERVAQARGRLRHLERKKAERLVAPKQARTMAAGIKVAKRSGDLVLEARGVSKSYDGTMLFKGVDWAVRRGDRWGVIGGNGTGKSTLVKCILGVVRPDAGDARIGANVDIGYFSQDATELDHESTPLEILNRECDMEFPAARSLLGRFLLSGEQVFQPVGTLSGGEKNKLSLAKITAMKPNTLILDEPTNHLDMDSREALADVIRDFEGTLVLVSHDRHLLERVTNKTLDLRDGGVVQYPGSYAEYKLRLKREDAALLDMAAANATGMSQREVSKEISRLEKEVSQIESDVARAEALLADHEKRLASLGPNADFQQETALHAEMRAELSDVIAEWESTVQQLEQLRRMQGA
ncbi:MAG: ATP-binding cassette domain-containing protein [Armatimonadota bacterium]|nr:ATP-binding cassette domain-containing protein [Armatimonadota bacterium]